MKRTLVITLLMIVNICLTGCIGGGGGGSSTPSGNHAIRDDERGASQFTVTSVSPAPNSTIPVNAEFSFGFDSEPDISKFNLGIHFLNETIEDEEMRNEEIICSKTGQMAIKCKPSRPLATGANYKIMLSSDIKDINNKSLKEYVVNYKTNNQPVVISSTPESGIISRNITQFSYDFSESMNVSTLTTGNAKFTDQGIDGKPENIMLPIKCSAYSGTEMLCQTTANLLPRHRYEMLLSDEIKSSNHVSLKPETFIYVADHTIPKITSAAPGSGDIKRDISKFTYTFSEPMMIDTLNSSKTPHNVTLMDKTTGKDVPIVCTGIVSNKIECAINQRLTSGSTGNTYFLVLSSLIKSQDNISLPQTEYTYNVAAIVPNIDSADPQNGRYIESDSKTIFTYIFSESMNMNTLNSTMTPKNVTFEDQKTKKSIAIGCKAESVTAMKCEVDGGLDGAWYTLTLSSLIKSAEGVSIKPQKYDYTTVLYADTLNFITMSDIHYHVSASKMIINRNSDNGGYLDPETYKTLFYDAQNPGFGIVHTVKNDPEIKFAILLGDIAAGDGSYKSVFKNLKNDFLIPIVNTVGNNDMMSHNGLYTKKMVDLITDAGWKNPFLSTGNNCYSGELQFPCVLQKESANTPLNQIIGQREKEGYAAVWLHPGVKYISFNSVLDYEKASPYDSEAARQELVWFESQLQASENNHEAVLVGMHVPFASEWRSTELKEFGRIIKEHPGTVIGILTGHSHMEKLQAVTYQATINGKLQRLLIPMIYTAAISTNHGNAPAFKEFQLVKQGGQWAIKNFDTYSFQQESQTDPVTQVKLYNFIDAFCPNNLEYTVAQCMEKNLSSSGSGFNSAFTAKAKEYYSGGNKNYSPGSNGTKVVKL